MDSFAYAVVQDSDCWCSNYTPDDSTTEDTTKCSSSCPGYPSDTCGGDGLYGYMSLSKEPSGTKGSGSSTSTSTQVSVPVLLHLRKLVPLRIMSSGFSFFDTLRRDISF